MDLAHALTPLLAKNKRKFDNFFDVESITEGINEMYVEDLIDTHFQL
jgi:hypothetical protein